MTKQIAYLTRFFGFNAVLIIGFFLARLIVDTVVRMVFPFITPFAYGLGLTVTGFGVLLSLRSWVGILDPIIGVVADRYGKKRMMLLGLLLQAIGLLSMIFVQGWAAAGPMILIGLGASSFVPITQAYISDQVEYEKRGRSLVFVDMAFAISGIVALPLIGWLIETADWRYPFGILGLLSLCALVFIWWVIPKDERHEVHEVHVDWRAPIVDLRLALSTPAVLVVMATGMLLFFAFAGFSTSWALWMGEQFGLSTLEIGFVATRISLAELVGVIFSLLFIDRIGKRVMVRSGFLLAIILFLAWLWLPPVRWLSQIILLLLGGVLETTIVSYFPFISDLLPKARATLFSLAVLGISVGLALAPPVTLFLWEQFGQGVIIILMVLILLAALLLTGSRALKNST